MEATAQQQANFKRNWWKWAFLAALIALEFSRELIVLMSNPTPDLAGGVELTRIPGYVMAAGRWKTIDEGSPLLPVLVSLQCEDRSSQCILATVNVTGNTVFAPNVSTYAARFSDDGISFDDTFPACVNYHYRVDFNLKTVTGLRERKPSKLDVCKRMEERMTMQLVDAYQPRDQAPEHFVPLLSALIAFGKLF